MKRSISRPLVGLPSPSAPLPIEGTISCSICQAVYAPARLHSYLLQAPPIALESAFLGMCHFCFRCRRPSCPNCWDAIRAVCGQCTAKLTFPFVWKLHLWQEHRIPRPIQSFLLMIIQYLPHWYLCNPVDLGNPPTIHECYIRPGSTHAPPRKINWNGHCITHIDIDTIETDPTLPVR